MALLSEEKRKEYFKELGLGEYNKTNILKLQKKYMARKTDYDGVYGTDCDNLLRHLKAVKDCCNDFAPEEFRCGCNGRYCCGYPTYMKPIELKNIQSIRSHFGKPMVVTCGLRCTHYNQAVGGITKSEHLYGLATDYYIAGVTDTLANRKNSIKWISKLPNHHYTYGNGIYAETTNGKTRTGSVSAPGMGNAMHTDSRESASGTDTSVKGAVLSDKKEILTVDGIAGPATVAQMQRFFKTTIDGVVSGQTKGLITKYYPSLNSVEYGSTGSPLVKAIQKWAGVTQDGLLGQATAKAWQKKLKTANYYSGTIDGVFGAGSMKAMQEFLNNDGKAKPTPTPTPTDSYTITYNANGGTGKMAAQKVAKGKAVTLSTNAFKRNGYTFMGWADDSGKPVMSGTDVTKFKNVNMKAFQLGKVTHKDKAKITPTKNITLYAVWKGCGSQAAVDWAVLIANDNNFAYGTKGSKLANQWGCYFCDSNKLHKPVKKRGDKWDKTYCCNTFIHAAFAHGTNNTAMLNACDQRHARKWGIAYSPKSFGIAGTKYEGIWNTKSHKWIKVAKSVELKVGDVMTYERSNGSGHTWLYIGDGKIVEASGSGFGANTIGVRNKTNKGSAQNIYRYVEK